MNQASFEDETLFKGGGVKDLNQLEVKLSQSRSKIHSRNSQELNGSIFIQNFPQIVFVGFSFIFINNP